MDSGFPESLKRHYAEHLGVSLDPAFVGETLIRMALPFSGGTTVVLPDRVRIPENLFRLAAGMGKKLNPVRLSVFDPAEIRQIAKLSLVPTMKGDGNEYPRWVAETLGQKQDAFLERVPPFWRDF